MTPRILFALPGLHLVQRGAEAAFEQIARGLCAEGFEVTLLGTGPEIPGRPYRYLQGNMRPRERFESWPRFPPLRSEYRYEELTFAPSVLRVCRAADFDLTVTCSYPFVNWALRMKKRKGRPQHVFVTENGDWAAHTRNREYRWFGCDGLVCTNPEYFERNRQRGNCALIPNGVHANVFTPGASEREAYGLPAEAKVVCMVSALIPSKFPLDGVRAVAKLPGVHLLLAGDGPLRAECDALGQELLGDRYHRMTVPMEKMPGVYRCGDVFLHLSRDEAFGNIYIESAACGLPVVAHAYPTTEWIFDGDGLLLDTSDGDALVRALTETLARPPDAVRSGQVRERLMARFDWPVVCREYAAFFRKLLDGQ